MAGVDDSIGRVAGLQAGEDRNQGFRRRSENSATVPVEVTKEEITALTADPPRLEMAAGDHRHLQVFGQAATSGLKEMFPQSDLKVAPQKGGTVDVIGGEDVQAKAIGDDTIDVSWQNKLKLEVPVNVMANAISVCKSRPDPRNRQRRAGGDLPGIGHAGRQPRNPHTRGWRADECHGSHGRQRGLRHDRPNHPPRTNQGGGRFRRTKGRGHFERHPGRGWAVATGDRRGRYHQRYPLRRHGGRVVIGGDTVVGGITPAGKVVGLVFEPPIYRAGVQALPQTAKLLRQYENGGFDDVSNDPNVKVTDPKSAVAKIEKVDGGWKVSPVAAGLTKLTATLDGQTAGMAIEINGGGGVAVAGESGRRSRETLDLWMGETKPINAAMDPGGGQPPCPSWQQSRPLTARESSASMATTSPAAQWAMCP